MRYIGANCWETTSETEARAFADKFKADWPNARVFVNGFSDGVWVVRAYHN